jgi:hypothetical protein
LQESIDRRQVPWLRRSYWVFLGHLLDQLRPSGGKNMIYRLAKQTEEED